MKTPPFYLMTLGLLMACPTDTKDTAPDETESAAETGETETEVEVDCDEGFEEGDCPPDFTLRNQDSEDFTLSEMRGNRVAIIGTAEW